MTTEFDKISEAADFQYKKLGYVDVNLLTKMTGIPHIIIQNVLTQCKFVESGIHDQFIKSQPLINDVKPD